MYIESEFALLEAQNEQLTREKKTLVEALWSAQPVVQYYGLEVVKELVNKALGIEVECTCLPDLPDGRVNGGRGGCCLVCEADSHDDEIPWQWGPSNRSEFGGE